MNKLERYIWSDYRINTLDAAIAAAKAQGVGVRVTEDVQAEAIIAEPAADLAPGTVVGLYVPQPEELLGDDEEPQTRKVPLLRRLLARLRWNATTS